MYKFINKAVYYICLILFYLLSHSAVFAQDATEDLSKNDSLDFVYLKNKYSLTDTVNLKKYESEILRYEENDRINGIKTGSIEFIGSSTINLWSYRINNDMYPLPVIDRGFGGSTLIQNIYYFKRLVKPYSPLIEVFYCANDFNITPNVVFEMFRYYEYLFHENFPTSILYYVSTNPSICITRKAFINNIDSTNKLIKDYIQKKNNTFYIDTFHRLMPNGIFDLSYFSDDSLHLNSKGYGLLTSIIKPIIQEKYNLITMSGNDISTISLFFNKKNNELYFSNIEDNSQLFVYSMNGKLLLKKRINALNKVQLNQLKHGVYIVSLLTFNKRRFRQKIII